MSLRGGSQVSSIVILAATVAGVLGISTFVFLRTRQSKQTERELKRSVSNDFEEFVPPLPKELVELLQIARLCYLSTSDGAVPHLSLMNFTYHQRDEVIIMSSRKDTKKIELLRKKNQNVAVLVHDFAHVRDAAVEESIGKAGGKTFSITLNGTAKIASGEKEEEYRKLHLENNPEYPQFIIGDNVVIIAVSISCARICNISDKVTYWSKDEKKQP